MRTFICSCTSHGNLTVRIREVTSLIVVIDFSMNVMKLSTNKIIVNNKMCQESFSMSPGVFPKRPGCVARITFYNETNRSDNATHVIPLKGCRNT
jgi:hypothetical protein